MTTQPTRLEVRANMTIEMECPTCGTLCVHSGEDDWTPVELLSASKPAAINKQGAVYKPEKLVPDGFWHWFKTDSGWNYRGALYDHAVLFARDGWNAAIQYSRAKSLAASPAAPAQSGEPVYQARFVGKFAWMDFSKEEWDIRQGSLYEKRIVYAAPQPSPTAVEACNAKRFPTPISISTDKICEIAGKYNLGNPRLDALRGFVNEVIIVNEAEYAKSE
jgi:hypothetical protein